MKKYLVVVLFLAISIGMTGCGMLGTSQSSENANKELDALKKEKEDLQKKQDELANQKQKLEADKKKVAEKIDETLSKLNKGMLYSEARQVIMKGGWTQVRSDTSNAASVTEGVKDQFFEVVSCDPTPDMPCTFKFKGPNNKTLIVRTTGESDFTVTSWTVK